MNIYQGTRTEQGIVVTKNGRPLLPGRSQAVRNHSPDGFNWGYGGSGPAQLALALLLEECPKHVAQNTYQKFKFSVVGRMDEHGWLLTSHDIILWFVEHKIDQHAEEVDWETEEIEGGQP